MSRDATGNYTSPSSSFVTGTTISSSVTNGKLDDIGSEITNSLDRNGKGGMLARLRGVDGSSALPAYAFTAETTLGLYRAGTGDLRVSSNGTDIMKWSSTSIVVYQAPTFQKGVVATNSTTNGNGGAFTGNGTGAGGVFTGGATGQGATFAAGGGNAAGATGTGAGTEPGLSGVGGATGPGVRGQGGATSGPGGFFLASGGNSAGVSSTGNGSGAGASLTGGATGPGATVANGTAATATDPTNALVLTNGNLLMSGTAPNADEALSNTIAPSSITKVRARVRLTDANTVTVDSGFNVASASIAATSDTIVITFASAFAASTYQAVACGNYIPLIAAQTTTTISIQLFTPGSASALDLDNAGNAGAFVAIECGGAQ
jgi:hypothetical protein